MFKKTVCVILTGVVFAVFTMGAAVSQEKGKEGMKEKMESMQEEWAKYANPGPHHEHLKSLAGSWDLNVKTWMDPSAPPMESTGTSDKELIMGGRFVYEETQAGMMGQDFEGMGITGYNSAMGRYQMAWLDNMGTMIAMSEGSFDEKEKTLTLWNRFTDPKTGKEEESKMVMHMAENDKHVFEYFGTAPDGSKVKVMEIVYIRKK
jgi:hypothetical protein